MSIRPCKYCKQRVLWVLTENDKFMSLNHRPDSAGNAVIIDHKRGYGVVKIFGKPADIPEGKVRYMPHKATCRNPGGFRRQRLSKASSR